MVVLQTDVEMYHTGSCRRMMRQRGTGFPGARFRDGRTRPAMPRQVHGAGREGRAFSCRPAVPPYSPMTDASGPDQHVLFLLLACAAAARPALVDQAFAPQRAAAPLGRAQPRRARSSPNCWHNAAGAAAPTEEHPKRARCDNCAPRHSARWRSDLRAAGERRRGDGRDDRSRGSRSRSFAAVRPSRGVVRRAARCRRPARRARRGRDGQAWRAAS